MKKFILILILLSLFLTACGQNKNEAIVDKEQIETKLFENTKLVNVEEKFKNIETKLKQSGLSGEKLEKVLETQKKGYEIIANLKGDERKKYIFQNEILPKLIENKDITSEFCKTKNMDLYLKCLGDKNISFEKVKKVLPDSMKDFIKGRYYYQLYLNHRKKLLEKIEDEIAQKGKKKVLKYLYKEKILKKNACKKIPEYEVQVYCEDLFN